MHRCITRRDVLKAMPAATLALSVPAFAKAQFAMPAGACDGHVHIYDTAFPFRPGLPKPPAQSGTALQYRSSVQQDLGLTRAIIVTASAYGTDNTVTLDAMRRLGRHARGAAILAPDISDAELKTLHDAGVRGARILPAGVPGLEALAQRVAPLGWHLQISLGGPAIAELEPVLMRQPAPFLLDHCAHVPLPAGITSPVYAAARRMLDGGKGWVKVSVPYDDSKIGPPDFPDFSAVARDYVRHNPERVVWGTGWPYAPDKPFLTAKAMTNILASWAPDANVRHRILVENPETLYGFDAKDRPR